VYRSARASETNFWIFSQESQAGMDLPPRWRFFCAERHGRRTFDGREPANNRSVIFVGISRCSWTIMLAAQSLSGGFNLPFFVESNQVQLANNIFSAWRFLAFKCALRRFEGERASLMRRPFAAKRHIPSAFRT
jgi:hypothetical protein